MLSSLIARVPLPEMAYFHIEREEQIVQQQGQPGNCSSSAHCLLLAKLGRTVTHAEVDQTLVAVRERGLQSSELRGLRLRRAHR